MLEQPEAPHHLHRVRSYGTHKDMQKLILIMTYRIGFGIRNGTGGLDNICIFTSTYEIFEFDTVKEKCVVVE